MMKKIIANIGKYSKPQHFIKALYISIIFSIIYGFFEYSISPIVRIIEQSGLILYVYWAGIFVLNMLLVYYFTKSLSAGFLTSTFIVPSLQEMFYFISQWIHTKVYPFPITHVSTTLPELSLFSWFAQNTSFFPFMPRYYLIFPCIYGLFFIFVWLKDKGGR